MPEIGKIQSTNFQELVRSLGITRPEIPFALRSEVTPVVLVGGTVSFIAPPSPAYEQVDWFTAGELVAPVGGTVMADTGPLPIGAYSVVFTIHGEDVSGFRLEWRDAANAADVRSQRVDSPVGGFGVYQHRFDILTTGERFRVQKLGNGTVALVYQASILAKI